MQFPRNSNASFMPFAITGLLLVENDGATAISSVNHVTSKTHKHQKRQSDVDALIMWIIRNKFLELPKARSFPKE